jgi:hypothetical protein
MPDESPILKLPYILPAQAQKHVTHNEALRILDIVTQLSVISRGLNTPPATPSLGNRYIVGSSPTGAWAGQAHRIAFFGEAGWEFVVPLTGWQAFVQASGDIAAWDGTDWVTSGVPTEVPRLGISTAADTTNRLAVSAAASLFTHAGAGDHRMKINKDTAADTASLVFQNSFSGRAEMGLAGTDNFAIKVSPDGTTFHTGLTVTRTDGKVTMPSDLAVTSALSVTGATTLTGALTAQAGATLGGGTTVSGTLSLTGAVTAAVGGSVALNGPVTATGTVALNGGVTAAAGQTVTLAGPVTAAALTVNGTLLGTAAQGSDRDATAQRLLRVGAFGLGTQAVTEAASWDTIAETGLYRSSVTTTTGLPAALAGWVMLHIQGETNTATQIALRTTVDDLRIRRRTAGTWGGWVTVYHTANVLAAVAQVAGVPTGGVLERGSNANGEFVRFADGTLICTRTNLSVTNASTAVGQLFRSSANVTWTFPVAFSAAPVVKSDCDNADCWATVGAAPTTTTVQLRAVSPVSQAAALTIRAVATGRWF